MRIAKKPAILPDKIKLAESIRKLWVKSSTEDSHPKGYYWTGIYESPSGDLKVRIFFQRYSRNIFKVDYVKIHWETDFSKKALSVQEIKILLKSRITKLENR